MKKWHQSRTIRLAIVAVLTAILGALTDLPEQAGLGDVSLKDAGLTALVAGLSVFLRMGQGVPIEGKQKALFLLLVVPSLVLATGCAGTPANTAPAVQGAQTLTGQQGQAAETGSATVYANPWILNLFGIEKLTLRRKTSGDTELEAEGGGGELAIDGDLTLPGVQYGESAAQAEVSSGGGSVAGASGGAAGGGGTRAGSGGGSE